MISNKNLPIAVVLVSLTTSFPWLDTVHAAPLQKLENACNKGKRLAAALEKAKKAGGGLIVVSGTCKENLVVDFPGLTLRGDTQAATLTGVTVNSPTLRIEGVSVLMENLTVADGGGSGITLKRGAVLKLTGSKVVKNKGNGIEVDNNATAEIRSTLIQDNGLSALLVTDGGFVSMEGDTIKGGQASDGGAAILISSGGKVTSSGDKITGQNAPAVVVSGGSQFSTGSPQSASQVTDGTSNTIQFTEVSRTSGGGTDGTSNTIVVSESSNAELNNVNVTGTTEISDGSSSTIGFGETPGTAPNANLDKVRVGWRSYVQIDDAHVGGSVKFVMGDGSVRTVSNTLDGSIRTIVEDSQVRCTPEAQQQQACNSISSGESVSLD